ncbi:MAG: hypothetical protein AB8G05_09965 [Oligoflexales bacterium]
MGRIFVFLVLLIPSSIFAGNIDYRSTNRLEPEDYLLGSFGELEDTVFDRYRTVSLEVDIGIASDCGRIDVRNTMRAALKNILDTKYLGALGRNIIASSPMLLTCYMSPTWCAILKQFRLRANFLAQLRLNQCKAINKYVDGRVSDFYEERSKCVRNSISRTGGNFEKSMESCGNYGSYNITDWAGTGKKKDDNRIIESTAKWAGFTGKEAKRIVNLTKAFIGDDIVKRGNVSVDYGPRRIQFSPRTYLMEVKESKYETLCQRLLPKLINEGGPRANIYSVVSNRDLKDVSGGNRVTLDRQTLLSLSYLPYKKRRVACRKLSEALALGNFNEDMSKTLDFIAGKIGTNPHLPTKKQAHVARKRQAFKDQIELTLSIENQSRTPLNKVLYQINKEGAKYRKIASKRELNTGQDQRSNRHVDSIFMDCGDGIGCSQ